MEEGEAPEAAAERELKEESGLFTNIVIEHQIGTDSYALHGGRSKTVDFFLARSVGAPEFVLPEEATKEVKWVTDAELFRLRVKFEPQKLIVRRALTEASKSSGSSSSWMGQRTTSSRRQPR